MSSVQRPFIIAFASPKGGVGKSTSCLNLAGALAASGHDVHIMDLDQTQTLGRWAASHRETLATKIPNLSVDTYPEQQFLDHINATYRTRTGFILVDVAGALSQAMLNAATVAHLTITPAKLSEPDIMEASKLNQQMTALSQRVGKPITHRILINEVGKLLAGYETHALNQIAALGLPRFDHLIHKRAAYGEVMFTGDPPHFADRSRAAIARAVEEIDYLVAEVFLALQDQQRRMEPGRMNHQRFKDLAKTPPAATPPPPPTTDPDFNALGSTVKAFSDENNVPQQVLPKSSSQQPTPPANSPAAPANVVTIYEPKKTIHRLTVDIPDYLYADIRDRAKKTTMKHVVITAFHKAGFHVATEDLIEDGRRKP